MSSAIRKFIDSQITNREVATGGAVTQGYLLIPGATAGTVNNATAPPATGMYIAKETAVAGARVDCFGPGSGCVPVKVGTGGATAGNVAMWSASNDGFCDAPAMANGATHTYTFGRFDETGAAGTIVGLWFTTGGEREST